MQEIIKATPTDVIDSIIPQAQRDEYEEKVGKLANREWTFSIVPGFFKQSDDNTDDSTYDPLLDHFGLALPSWKEAVDKVHALNAASDEGTKYKLIFCARHGQGFHNEIVEVFGLREWETKYSHLEGTIHPVTGEYISWAPDPYLNKIGYGQAEYMHELVDKEVKEFGMPLPDKIYVSPFTRSCETLKTTMKGVCLNEEGTGMKPTIVENLRETIGKHLCDKRSSKSVICERQSKWGFEFEQGFVEEDELYKDDWRESPADVAVRGNLFLQKLFSDDHDNEQILWNCTHSGQIRAMLIATGHRSWTVPTAGMIPLVIKADRL